MIKTYLLYCASVGTSCLRIIIKCKIFVFLENELATT